MPLRVPSAQCLKSLRTLPRIIPRCVQTIRLQSNASGIFTKRIAPIEGRLQELMDEGVIDPYPRYSRPSETTPALRIQEFNVKYLDAQNNQVHEDVSVTVQGRVRNIRALSNKLWFLDLEENGFRLQVIANRRLLEGYETNFKKLHQRLRKGDIICMQLFCLIKFTTVMTDGPHSCERTSGTQ